MTIESAPLHEAFDTYAEQLRSIAILKGQWPNAATLGSNKREPVCWAYAYGIDSGHHSNACRGCD